jgi:hypothetical protein
VGGDLSRAACKAAEELIAKGLKARSLVGAQPPTQHAEKAFRDTVSLLRAYDRSISFYRELLEDEGRGEFRPKLEAALRARDDVEGRQP